MQGFSAIGSPTAGSYKLPLPQVRSYKLRTCGEKLCNTGKDIFYSINEAKYNDYVIYNTPTGKVEVLPTSPEEEA